jgi:hypothetical protein
MFRPGTRRGAGVERARSALALRQDAAREAAEVRLRTCLQQLADEGVDANGHVGDSDPLLALEDALRLFPADGIVIATHPEQRSNWLACHLVARARERFWQPVLHVVVDAPDPGWPLVARAA